MYRTNTCGELRLEHLNKQVTLSGWVQRVRNLGGMTFVDLRDRYGITQLAFNMETNALLCEQARKLGREFVIQASGTVVERSSKNTKMPTGEVEILSEKIVILNKSEVPPFTIEDESDGGDELRMKYRYLDLRRNPLRDSIMLRHRVAQATREYLNEQLFLEIETPVLIKSTPEGARDFVVPSRMHSGNFYALPQSPQVFKQLLMLSGFDRYYQIVKCFRDEDLRADRQPEFTQIDCEMAFVEQEDILRTFEGLIVHLVEKIKGISLQTPFKRMTYDDAMAKYGNDKPDLRFDMAIHDISDLVKGKDFKIFDEAEYIGGICAKACNEEYSRKKLDALTEFVKKPQIGAQGLVYVKCNQDGSFKSSVDKFYSQEDLAQWATAFGAEPNDLILVLSGKRKKTLPALSELRLEMANQLGLRNNQVFEPLWVIDFPLFEWDEETNRLYAMHHPFTSAKPEDWSKLKTDPAAIRANAYDMVLNGVEIGGGSIRIHNTEMQQDMFEALGFSPEQAQAQFGFLIDAFKYGAPPHGGIAFGMDRLTSLFAGQDSIRDVIAFPKNNAGRDVMIDAPSPIADDQLTELSLRIQPVVK